MAKVLNVPGDTVGSIVCKFKVKGTVVTVPVHGRKGKLSVAAGREQLSNRTMIPSILQISPRPGSARTTTVNITYD